MLQMIPLSAAAAAAVAASAAATAVTVAICSSLWVQQALLLLMQAKEHACN